MINLPTHSQPLSGSLLSPPGDMAVTELNSTHLRVSWLPPPPPHTPSLTHYSIYINNFMEDVTIHVMTRTPSLDVSRPGGSLEINVRACSAAGEGEASSVIYKRGGGDGYRSVT